VAAHSDAVVDRVSELAVRESVPWVLYGDGTFGICVVGTASDVAD